MNKTLEYILQKMNLTYMPEKNGFIIIHNNRKIFIDSSILNLDDELEAKEVILAIIK